MKRLAPSILVKVCDEIVEAIGTCRTIKVNTRWGRKGILENYIVCSVILYHNTIIPTNMSHAVQKEQCFDIIVPHEYL